MLASDYVYIFFFVTPGALLTKFIIFIYCMYFSGTAHIYECYCKYARISQEARFFLSVVPSQV